MATTRYTVSATASHEEKVMSNLKSAKAEADRRAEADGQSCQVKTVATGRVSYTAAAPEAPAADEFEALIAEVKAERQAETEKVAAEAERKLADALLPVVRQVRPRRAGRREALGESVVPGWELLYDKPRQDAQVGRKDGKYALICTRHKTAHPLAKLVEERKLRQGERTTWCSECGGN